MAWTYSAWEKRSISEEGSRVRIDILGKEAEIAD